MPNTLKINRDDTTAPDAPLPGKEPAHESAGAAPPVDKALRPAAMRFQVFTPPELGVSAKAPVHPPAHQDALPTERMRVVIVPGWFPGWMRAIIRRRSVLLAVSAAVCFGLVATVALKHFAAAKPHAAGAASTTLEMVPSSSPNLGEAPLVAPQGNASARAEVPLSALGSSSTSRLVAPAPPVSQPPATHTSRHSAAPSRLPPPGTPVSGTDPVVTDDRPF